MPVMNPSTTKESAVRQRITRQRPVNRSVILPARTRTTSVSYSNTPRHPSKTTSRFPLTSIYVDMGRLLNLCGRLFSIFFSANPPHPKLSHFISCSHKPMQPNP